MKNMIQTQISLPKALRDKSKTTAFKQGISLSEFIRQGLELRLQQEPQSPIYGKQFFEEISGGKKK